MNQDFHGDVGLVVNGDVESIRLEPTFKRPKTPEQSRVCPQCHETTWKRSQFCVHCNLDLFAHDMEKKRQTEILAAQARRDARVKFGGVMIIFGITLFVIGTKMHDITDHAWLMSVLGLITGLAGAKHMQGD